MSQENLYLLIYDWPGGYDLEGVFTTREKAREYAVAKCVAENYREMKLGRDGVPWPWSIEELELDPQFKETK